MKKNCKKIRSGGLWRGPVWAESQILTISNILFVALVTKYFKIEKKLQKTKKFGLDEGLEECGLRFGL